MNSFRDEEKKRRIIYLIGFVIAGIILLIFLGKEDAKTPSITKVCTAKTMGEVTYVDRSSRGYSHTLGAKFVIDGVEYNTKGRYSYNDYREKGIPVVIHYNPEDPKTSYAADGPPIHPNHVEAFLLIVVFILIQYLDYRRKDK